MQGPAIPKDFEENFKAVDISLNLPFAELEITEIHLRVDFHDDDDVPPSAVPIGARWTLYMLLSDSTSLVINMRRKEDNTGRAPGVLFIGHTQPGTREWDEKRLYDIHFTQEIPMLKRPGGRHKVRDFLNLLLEAKLLRYTFEPGTHPFNWLFYVLYRLVLAGYLPGGTSRETVLSIADLNEKIATEWKDLGSGRSRGRPAPQIDLEVMSKPGEFT